MTDQPADIVLEILKDVQAKLTRTATTEEVAAIHQRLDKADATVTRMHADVMETKALGKELKAMGHEIGLRLALVEERLGRIEAEPV